MKTREIREKDAVPMHLNRVLAGEVHVQMGLATLINTPRKKIANGAAFEEKYVKLSSY